MYCSVARTTTYDDGNTTVIVTTCSLEPDNHPDNVKQHNEPPAFQRGPLLSCNLKDVPNLVAVVLVWCQQLLHNSDISLDLCVREGVKLYSLICTCRNLVGFQEST
jgi:hypothetical protein